MLRQQTRRLLPGLVFCHCNNPGGHYILSLHNSSFRLFVGLLRVPMVAYHTMCERGYALPAPPLHDALGYPRWQTALTFYSPNSSAISCAKSNTRTFPPPFPPSDLISLYEFRLTLEPPAARLAA